MLHAKAPKIRYGPMSLSYLQSYMCELAEIDLKEYLGGDYEILSNPEELDYTRGHVFQWLAYIYKPSKITFEVLLLL